MKSKLYLIVVFLMVLYGCNSNVIEVENLKKNTLKATHQLELTETKKFKLDSVTAPSPQTLQIYTDSSGQRNITFLNTYNNSIYFYNYDTKEFLLKRSYDKKGPDGILRPMGFYIKNMDSIYIYDMHRFELALTNTKSQIKNKISLHGENDPYKSNWLLNHPQYAVESLRFLELPNQKLILTGQFTESVPSAIIEDFKFTATIDLKKNEVVFNHSYPKELYGNDSNWPGQIYTEVFSELHPDGDKLIYSFPVSHDVYIAGLGSGNYKKIYGGSNLAETISAVDAPPNKISRERLVHHVVSNDEYASIRYDKYRNVYYRLIRRAIPDATINTNWKEKSLAVIIMDKDFNYLGETTLGKYGDWSWKNFFVTKEGLNIEYMDNDDIDEVSLTLKIFKLKKV